MRLLDAFSLSMRTYKTRPLRTFLTILGVSVGIGAVLFLVSFGYGLQNAILNQITTADSLLSLDVSSGAADIISLKEADIDSISKIENVEEVSPVASFSSQITIDNLTGDGIVFAVKPSFFRLGGVTLSYGEEFKGDNDIIISSAGAKLFNITSEDIINKEISMVLFLPKISEDGFEEVEVVTRENKYRVVGVVEDENTSYVFIPSKTISDLEITKYDQLKVKVSDNKYMDEVRSAIIEKGFLVSSLSDTIEQANKIFKIIQIILSLFGLIALVVSAIGMFNTMTITLLERINEIGIMRAIGITKKDIRIIFLFESVIMGFLGGVFGIFVGFIAGETANLGINILAKSFGGQALDLFYRPIWFMVFIVIFSTVIGFITGIYPSIKASKLNPLTALRYK